MRHGLDTGGVGPIELTDEVENRRQALLIYRKLGGSERQARQVGDILDLFTCQQHRSSRATECEKQPKIIHVALLNVLSVDMLRATLGGPPPHFKFRSPIHVQTLARLFLQRSVDRSGNSKHSDLRP